MKVEVFLGPDWSGESVLWVILDDPDALRLYNSVQLVIDAVSKMLLSKYSDDKFDPVIDLYHRYIGVVPKVRGKSLHGNAWKFLTASLLKEDSKVAADFPEWMWIPHPLPFELAQKLGVELWEDARLDPSNRICLAVGELAVWAGHLSDLIAMPDVASAGVTSVSEHLDSVGKRIDALLKDIGSNAKEILEELTDGFDDLVGDREYLQIVGDALHDLVQFIQPFIPESDGQALAIEAFSQWRLQIREAALRGHVALLAWSTIILRRKSESPSHDSAGIPVVLTE